MDTNEHESEKKPLLLRKEVYKIVGCAMDVLNKIGPGLHEKPYENSLVVAFDDENIEYTQQARFPIYYRGREVSEFIPDLIACDAIVIDTKVIERITDHERGQMLTYLRVTGKRVGLILNFHKAKLEWERIVL